MALPALISHHIHISERKTGGWVDCAWCSLIMFIRLAYRWDLPATLAYATSIRARVQGPTGGATPSQVMAAARTIGQSGAGSAGIVLTPIVGAANIIAALKPGTVGLINGSMGAFPAGNVLRRWDPAFAGLHSVMVAHTDSTDAYWWDNPLAPVGTYQGERISRVNLAAFITKGGLASFVHALKPISAPPVIVKPPVIVVPPPVVVDPNLAKVAILQGLLDAQSVALKLEQNKTTGLTMQVSGLTAKIAKAITDLS